MQKIKWGKRQPNNYDGDHLKIEIKLKSFNWAFKSFSKVYNFTENFHTIKNHLIKLTLKTSKSIFNGHTAFVSTWRHTKKLRRKFFKTNKKIANKKFLSIITKNVCMCVFYAKKSSPLRFTSFHDLFTGNLEAGGRNIIAN